LRTDPGPACLEAVQTGLLCRRPEHQTVALHLVLDACLRRGIAVATVIGGGYDDLERLVERHGLVFRAAAEQARLHGL
ncbi:MAG: hypothetical protein R6U00_11970, partial [Prochlorococcaceae cyanobacterium]